ncbi:MAG: alcohol dehydrogenase catalytic domain-containing protein [Chloroflexota bacterium]
MYNIPETMRAAVLCGPSDLRVVERPVPVPGEVLVKVAACAICGSDPKLIAHPFPMQPPFGEFIPGHEWTGTVVALGPTVDELQLGDKVAVQSHRGCMRCENCLRGEYTVCLNYGNPRKFHRAPCSRRDCTHAVYQWGLPPDQETHRAPPRLAAAPLSVRRCTG